MNMTPFGVTITRSFTLNSLQFMTQNFKLAEFTRSATAARLGIDNTPSTTVVENLHHLCTAVLQPLRDHLGVPITITSGYRAPALNRAVGGSSTSQHMTGEAADLRLPRVAGTNRADLTAARRWMTFIVAHLPFDQLILEHDASGSYWLHVSSRRDEARNRHRVMELVKK